MILSTLALISSAAVRPFELDIALVADPSVNRKVIDSNDPEVTEADRKIWSHMKANSARAGFAVIDGSAPIGVSLARPDWTVDVSSYETLVYESAAQFVNGKKIGSEQTSSTLATRTSVTMTGAGPESRGSAVCSILSRSSAESQKSPIVCFAMPLIALQSDSKETKQNAPLSIFVAPLSTHEVNGSWLHKLPDPSQIVVCRWGTQRDDSPNLISFPPAGKFKHYRIGYDGKAWYAKLQAIVSLPKS